MQLVLLREFLRVCGIALAVILDTNLPDNDTNVFILLAFSSADSYFDTMVWRHCYIVQIKQLNKVIQSRRLKHRVLKLNLTFSKY
jgi:hypothetical protein